ncbi:MAG: L-fuculose-phosphate aldolase [Deferribacterota bacterium]|nr:L-fuculose-phosphate aldolase [Deferribacterota bacterium]
MELLEEREKIVEYGKKLITARLTKATGGNLSIFNKSKELIAISPSGMDYFETTKEDIVIIDLDNNIKEGSRKPSSESKMHLEIYKNREDATAVVHTHSTFATTIATLNWEIPPLHYLVAFAGTKVPCAKYATYGTAELAKNVVDALNKSFKACLLSNHGLISTGNSIEEAFTIAEITEFMAELFYRTKCIGKPVLLKKNEIEKNIEKFRNYGQ